MKKKDTGERSVAEKKWEGLQKKVESYLKRWNMIERGEHIVAGISGGADSVCLLFVLLRLRETQGIQVTAVHVNHLLRGKAADGDESFVAELCKRHDVPCRVFVSTLRQRPGREAVLWRKQEGKSEGNL